MASEILTHTAPKRTFPFTPFLRQTHRHSLLPDHDSTTSATTSTHDGRAPSLVCKHWLRGLCKKGEHCEFLHEYNLRKMPECNFFTRNGYCSNGEECLYLHIDPQSKLPPCPHYEQGFCPLGPACAKKHVRRRLCVFYLAGFCPDGRDCKEGSHPRWRRDLERPRRKSDVAREEGELKKEDDAQMRDAPPRDAGREREDRGFGGHMHRGGGRGGGGPGKWRGGGGGGGGRGRFRGRGH